MLFDAYENRLVRRQRARRTIINHRQAAAQLTAWCSAAGLKPEQLTAEEIEEYFAQSPLAPRSQVTHLKCLRATYGYAIKRGVLTRDPTVDVELPRQPDSEPRIIPSHELRHMRAALRNELDWRLYHLLVYTGMRRTEIRLLRWDEVNLPSATITVTKGKGGKLRHVPIHPALGEVLGAGGEGSVLPSKTSLHDETLHKSVRAWAGVYTPHDFRRTVASSLYANGVEPSTIDKIMGWAPRTVRSRYYVNIAPAQLQKAILQLYVDDPI